MEKKINLNKMILKNGFNSTFSRYESFLDFDVSLNVAYWCVVCNTCEEHKKLKSVMRLQQQ
jgi:hypothetical protein